MATTPTYRLKLHKTYYDKGFFNLGVEVEKYIRKDEGPVSIYLGSGNRKIEGRVNRTANTNGTPRIMGGVPLRDWLQQRYQLLEVVEVLIQGPSELRIQ